MTPKENLELAVKDAVDIFIDETGVKPVKITLNYSTQRHEPYGENFLLLTNMNIEFI